MNERNLTFDAHNRGYPDRIKGIRPKSPSHHLSPQLGLDFLFSRCQLNTNPPPLLPAVHYGGNNHQLKSVRPPTLLSLSLNFRYPRLLFSVWKMQYSKRCHLSSQTSPKRLAAPSMSFTTSSNAKPTSMTVTFSRSMAQTWIPR